MLSQAERKLAHSKGSAGAHSTRSLAFGYFLVSVTALIGLAVVLDRIVLPQLEKERILDSYGWKEEDRKIQEAMRDRNHADTQNPIWRSDLWTVNPLKKREKRILVLGDSFVWGDGYSNMNSLWWRQLERELKLRGYKNVEVIAAGLCDVQTSNEIEWVKALLPRYKPDAVLIGFVTNDPCEYSGPGVRYVNYFTKKEAKFVRQLRAMSASAFPYLTYQLFGIRSHSRTLMESGPEHGFESGEWERRLLEGANFEQYKKTVKELGVYARSIKQPLFLMTLPHGFHSKADEGLLKNEKADYFSGVKAYLKERYDPVKKVFLKEGLHFEDILDDFIESARNDENLAASNSPLRLSINPANSHPNEFATHFYAVKAADILERHYSWCLPEKENSPLIEKIRINDTIPGDIGLKKTVNGDWTFSFPSDSEKLLMMPIFKTYVQLNLENASALKEVALSGSGLKEVEVYATSLNKNGYDDGVFHKIGSGRGALVQFSLPDEDWARNVNSLRISARFANNDRSIVAGLR